MNERIKTSLFDILTAIDEVDEFLGNGPRRFDDFVGNKLLRSGVERKIEIIGEATNRILKVDPGFSITNARDIVGLRNYVIHAYDSLRPEMLWRIVIKDLPPLRAEVEKLLE
jgi:uncharacterized protein with HEPN domain